MKTKIHHVSAGIQGLLDNHSAKKLGEIFQMDGKEVKRELEDRLKKGHELIPAAGCKHFDPVKGCQCASQEDKEVKNG